MSEPGSRPKLSWIIALVGMLVVPIAGLVWAAVSGGPPDVTAESDETAAEDGEEAASSTGAASTAKKKKKKKAKSKTAKSGRKATHEAAPCCEALRKAGREEADVSKRPTFLAAASACDAAPTAARAMTQVKSIVEGSRLELPSDCAE